VEKGVGVTLEVFGLSLVKLKQIIEFVRETAYKIVEAIFFPRSIETKIDEIGKTISDDLKLPYTGFKLTYREKFTLFIKCIIGEYSSSYSELLYKHIDKIVTDFIKMNNLEYPKDILILFIIAGYRDNLKFYIGKNYIDIDLQLYLKILNEIKSDPYKKVLLASLYNIYIYGIAEKNMLDLLKKAREASDKIDADIFIEAIESMLQQGTSFPSFSLRLYNDIKRSIGEKEKITRALDKIEQRLRVVASRGVDVDKLLMLIELMKREFRPYRYAYILILLVREQMYNVLKTHQELFKQETSERAGRLRFKPIGDLSMKYLRELENEIFGLNREIHVLKTINAFVWPFGIVRRIEGMERIGIIYLVETDIDDTKLLWNAFINEVLSEKAKKLAFSGVIIPIPSRNTFIYEDISAESPHNPKQIYHKETYTKGENRRKKFLKYIEVEENTGKTEVQGIIEILFNLIKKSKYYELRWPKEDIIKFSDILRQQLRLSDLVSEFPLSENALLKLENLEEEIIRKLNEEFPELKIEKPLDIWILYRDEKLREKAISVISSLLSDISSEPRLIASDMLETAYIASMLGPYVQQGLLREYVLGK